MIRGAKRSLDFEQFYLSTGRASRCDDVLDAIGVPPRARRPACA